MKIQDLTDEQLHALVIIHNCSTPFAIHSTKNYAGVQINYEIFFEPEIEAEKERREETW